MKSIRKISLLVALLLVGLNISGCDTFKGNDADRITASGVVEAVEVIVSPELGGRIAEVFVAEGDRIQEGDPLFQLEDELLNAQIQQVVAAFEVAQVNLEMARAVHRSAQAGLDAAFASLEVAEAQSELEINAARLEDQPIRVTAWDRDIPNAFSMPGWFFIKPELIEAAEAEVEAAREALEIEREDYEKVIRDASNADMQEAQARLTEAQAAYLVAEELDDRYVSGEGREEITDYIDTIFDTAEAELESAQKEYDKLLSDDAAEDVLEAKARFVVSHERLQTALDLLSQLRTGEESLRVHMARASSNRARALVAQAEAEMARVAIGVVQAEKVLAQSQAALDVMYVQEGKLIVSSPTSGVVLSRSVEPGEVVQPGMTALVVGQLDTLTITVYIPEDRYGQINLGDETQIKVDSFPNETFEGIVTRIADEAEYTPRNVQTEEERRNIVFAIELSVNDPNGKLKPGMPADVVFGE
jgi:HlyD family secretion protein